MIVIADSNILVSALIKPDGSVASIFKEKSNIQFIAPDFLLVEVYEHWNRIAKYSPLSKLGLIRELDFYKKRIAFYSPHEVPKTYRTKAYEEIRDIDVDDTPFVALYFFKKHKIWTGDRMLVNGLLARATIYA